MIKFIVPRHNDTLYSMFAEPSMKKIPSQVFQVFDKPNLPLENIFKKYNAGIQSIIDNGLQDDDTIIFLHEDCGLVDAIFQEKVDLIFSEKPDVAIVGIAGATELTEKGGWWLNESSKLRGHLLQGKDGAKLGEGYHLQKGAIGFFDDVVCVDGCIIITKGKFIREGLRFDDKTFDSMDMYDIDLCLTAQSMGYKIAVADIMVYHQSSGNGVFNDAWKTAKDRLITKWTEKGYTLPFTTNQFPKKEIKSEIVEINI